MPHYIDATEAEKNMKLIDYIYYWFYKWQQKVGNSDIAHLTAYVALSLSVMVYVYGIIMLLSVLKWTNLPSPTNSFEAGGFGVIVMLLFYFTIMKNGKYKTIISTYSNETDNQKRRGVIIAVAYVIFGVLLLFGNMYLKMLQNEGKI